MRTPFSRLLVAASVTLLGCQDPAFDVGVTDDGGTTDDGGADTQAGDVHPDGALDGTPDTTTPIDGDAEAPPTCAGQKNGTPCGDGGVRRICLAEACVLSVCGDSFVDLGAGEQCDDGNETPRDGCEPKTCRFSCDGADVCDDKNPCTTGETCDLASHMCKAGTAVKDGTLCTQPGGGAGSCNAGVCAPASCGNGVVETGEECDDGNKIDTDGCKRDCTYTCKADADCSDGSVCTGTEKCVLATHVCAPGAPLVCADASACTADTCDPKSGCKSTFVDADGDGYAPATLGSCGLDCNDGEPNAKPGQKSFFGTPHVTGATKSFDWNCDGVVEREISTMGWCYYDDAGFCVFKEGFANPLPSCGETKQYITGCTLSGEGCYPSGPFVQMRCR